jgi:hypothetical protein
VANFPPGSPFPFGAQQRVSLNVSCLSGSPEISLFYTKEEFVDVVGRICSNPTKTFALDTAAQDYIYSLTNGHTAAVDALLGYLFEVLLRCSA